MMKQNSADYYFCKLTEEVTLLTSLKKNFKYVNSYKFGFYMFILKNGF